MSKPINVLIADDHTVLRMGLIALIETEKDMVVVGQAKNGEQAITETLRLRPDIIIMDLMMPVKDGVAATAEIKKLLPESKIIVLTTFGTADGISHALANGATSAVLKSADDTEILDAIRKTANGERYLSHDIQCQLEQNPPIEKLTKRQEEILHSITLGLTNSDISKQLGIRQDGVSVHINAIFRKLGAANRAEAVAIALRKHLLKI